MLWLAAPAAAWAVPFLVGLSFRRSSLRRRAFVALELVAVLGAAGGAVAVLARGVPAVDAVVAVLSAALGAAALAALSFSAGADPRRWWLTVAAGTATLVLTAPCALFLLWFVVSFATCEAADTSACPNS